MNQAPNEVVAPGAWRTLGWTSLAVFMALLDATILFVAFPSIRRSFPDVSVADLSWILNAYTIVYAALLVPAGRIADRVGRRMVFLSGVVIFTVGSLACGFALRVGLIVAGRVLQAAGGAMLTPSSLALVLASFPRSMRSVAVSLWAAVGALAAAVGPSSVRRSSSSAAGAGRSTSTFPSASWLSSVAVGRSPIRGIHAPAIRRT